MTISICHGLDHRISDRDITSAARAGCASAQRAAGAAAGGTSMTMPALQPVGLAARQGTAPTPGPSSPNPAPNPSTRPPPARWRSADLLGGATRVEIDHAGAVYQLRLTAQGKLILTK